MFKINASVSVRNRVELLWYGKKTEPHDPVSLTALGEQGFLTFFDFLFKPLLKQYSGNFRLQYLKRTATTPGCMLMKMMYYFIIPSLFSLIRVFDIILI